MLRRKGNEPAAHQSAPRRRFTDSLVMDTVIGPQVILRGDITGTTNLDVRGSVDGSIEIDGVVVLRAGCTLKGRIRARSAVVEGTLEGPIHVTEKLELAGTAAVTGDIQAQSIAIAEGSFLRGHVETSRGGVRQEQGRGQLSFEEKRTRDA